MISGRFAVQASIVALVTCVSLGSTACGPKAPVVKTADHIEVGVLPAGQEWPGVYYSQSYGFLHITETSGAISGAWRTTAGDKWGELWGEANGDLVRFKWTEHKIGVVGPSATSEGRGYFKYVVKNPKEPAELVGEWGLGENEAGHPWNCLKQKNMDPDPKSVRPDEMESRVGAAGFDGNQGDAAVEVTDDSEEEADESSEE
ncbi:MAG: hypothetical protein MK135_15305 [Polyangiaceae bacterium]|nr:hypothetical protein [Polyangiaceae bacterium]